MVNTVIIHWYPYISLIFTKWYPWRYISTHFEPVIIIKRGKSSLFQQNCPKMTLFAEMWRWKGLQSGQNGSGRWNLTAAQQFHAFKIITHPQIEPKWQKKARFLNKCLFLAYHPHFGPLLLEEKNFFPSSSGWNLLEIWSGRKYMGPKKIARLPSDTLKKVWISLT